jgi:hypothetical protein
MSVMDMWHAARMTLAPYRCTTELVKGQDHMLFESYSRMLVGKSVTYESSSPVVGSGGRSGDLSKD